MTKTTLEDLNITWRRVQRPERQASIKFAMEAEGVTADLEKSDVYELDDQAAVEYLAQIAVNGMQAITGFRASEEVLALAREGALAALDQMIIEQLGDCKSSDIRVNDETYRYAPKHVLERAGYVDSGDGRMKPPTLTK